MTEPWILCVDDDERLLSGLELHLGFDHDVQTAISGKAGLALLDERPDCAVIVSDMRMPEMNGAEFLARSRLITPDTTRMLLTGFSEVADTVSAVNDGGIFRFLTKPIPPDALVGAVEAGLRQWHLIRTERVLLEETLNGAVQSLIEALEIASPATFSRSRRVEAGCRHVAVALGLEPVWEVALAGLLMRIGWISLPSDVVDRRLSGIELSEADASMLEDALKTTVRLVDRIPRLDGVARIIGDSGPATSTTPSTAANVVRAVADFDDALRLGRNASKALAQLASDHHHTIVEAIKTWPHAGPAQEIREVGLTQLIAGMSAAKDIMTPSGNLLVKEGADLTETLIQRLRNFALSHGVVEPIYVASEAG